MADSGVSRRYFFFGSLLAGAVPSVGFGSSVSLKALGYKSPNEKLNIASIGAGGKAASDITGCETENIVALCDPDSKRAAAMFQKHEKAPKYTDFRKMLDKEEKNIDAVIVAIPDFMHGTAAMWAMERGKHVFCQKPLTRTIWEARSLSEAAVKYKVATQMGNQGYSNEGARRCAEMIWAGEIGNVTEVHAWTNRPVWPQGLQELPPPAPVPETLDWPTWLGIAADRPYSPAYAPFNWRGYFDFGCGALGDMACHILGAPNMALMLGAPTSVECLKQEGKSSFTYPSKSVIRFDFPARNSMPAVKVFWYDGCMEAPFRPEGLAKDQVLGDLPRRRPPTDATAQTARTGRPNFTPGAPTPEPDWKTEWQRGIEQERPPEPARQASAAAAPSDSNARLDAEVNRRVSQGSNGSLFIGDKGLITTGTYGENTRLLPVEKMEDYKLPPALLTRSPGHYRDWIRAAKGGEPSCSNFSVAGPFTEWILLGALSLRFEGKLEWDSAKMRVTNNQEANQLLKPKFKKGWQFT
ncbi:MAG: Gfo/Idh/MocA family oxidoreductase [Acidobacteriota bacterium]|nr:Gfo/Idh/MocA family oxidoreductase [Acidobacteriota bacterium]